MKIVYFTFLPVLELIFLYLKFIIIKKKKKLEIKSHNFCKKTLLNMTNVNQYPKNTY